MAVSIEALGRGRRSSIISKKVGLTLMSMSTTLVFTGRRA